MQINKWFIKYQRLLTYRYTSNVLFRKKYYWISLFIQLLINKDFTLQ